MVAGVEAARRGGPLRRAVRDHPSYVGEAGGPRGWPVEAVAEDHVQHRQQQVRVGPRPDRDVLGGEPGGLGAAGVHHHHPPAAGDHVLQPTPGVGHRGEGAVGDRRVGPEHQQVLGAVDVGDRQDRVVAEHELGGEVLRELVDRCGREDVAAAQHLLEALDREDRRGVGRRVAEVGAHRVAPVLVAQRPQPPPGQVERLGPGDLLEAVAHPTQGSAQPLRVVVQRLERGALGAQEAAAQHVVGVALDPQHLLAPHAHADAAVGLAERTLALNDRGMGHRARGEGGHGGEASAPHP